MKKYGLCLTALSLVFSFAANAEDLGDVIRYTLENNPELASARATMRSVEARQGQAKSGYKPKVALVGDAALEHREYELSSLPDTIKDDVVPYSYGVQASMNLFEGGKTMYATKAAKFETKAQEHAVEAKTTQLISQTAQAYLDYLDAVNVQKLQKNNVDVMRAHYVETRDKAKFGRLTSTDVAQAQARLEGAKALLTQADMGVDNASERFFRITGKAPELTQTPDIAAVLNAAPATQGERDIWNLIKDAPATLAEAEKIAQEQNPSLKELIQRENAAAEQVKVAKNTSSPSLDLSAYAGRQEKQIMMDTLTDYQAKLSLSVPLYDASVSHYKKIEALEAQNAVKYSLSDARAAVREAVRTAWNAVSTRKSEILYAQAQIKANKKALDGVIDEARNGTRTTLDVLNAQQEYLDSQVSLSHAQYGLVNAKLSLLQAMGVLKL